MSERSYNQRNRIGKDISERIVSEYGSLDKFAEILEQLSSVNKSTLVAKLNKISRGVLEWNRGVIGRGSDGLLLSDVLHVLSVNSDEKLVKLINKEYPDFIYHYRIKYINGFDSQSLQVAKERFSKMNIIKERLLDTSDYSLEKVLGVLLNDEHCEKYQDGAGI